MTIRMTDDHTAAPSGGQPTERQRARRQRALDAYIDLVLEGHTPPPPELLAEHAGVSRATFFRYFSTLDELRHEAAARVLDRFPDLFVIPEIGRGDRAQRIERFADARVDMHETLHPLELLLRTTTMTDPGSAALVHWARRALADQVREHFDPELRPLDSVQSEDTVTAISSLTSIESWDQLRRSHDRTPAQVRRAWTSAIDQLLPDG